MGLINVILLTSSNNNKLKRLSAFSNPTLGFSADSFNWKPNSTTILVFKYFKDDL